MANAYDLPSGVEIASGMLTRTNTITSVGNTFVVQFDDIDWGLPPGHIIGIWGLGMLGANLQADADQNFVALSVDPSESQTAVQDLFARQATILTLSERLDIVTSGGSVQQLSGNAPKVMLPYPIFTVTNSRVGFAQRSAGAALMSSQVYYAVYRAQTARLIELAGLSLSR